MFIHYRRKGQSHGNKWHSKTYIVSGWLPPLPWSNYSWIIERNYRVKAKKCSSCSESEFCDGTASLWVSFPIILNIRLIHTYTLTSLSPTCWPVKYTNQIHTLPPSPRTLKHLPLSPHPSLLLPSLPSSPQVSPQLTLPKRLAEKSDCPHLNPTYGETSPTRNVTLPRVFSWCSRRLLCIAVGGELCTFS